MPCVQQADGDVCQYEKKLAGYSDRLTSDVDAVELRRVVEHLAEETRAVRESSAELHERLSFFGGFEGLR